MKQSKAIFAGSFDPFHQGHELILNKALKLFEQVILLVANSDEKNNHSSLETRYQAVQQQLKLPNVVVDKLMQGYVANYAKQYNVNYLIRSVRDCFDFEYEVIVNQTNKSLNPELETIIFFPNEITKQIRSSNFKK